MRSGALDSGPDAAAERLWEEIGRSPVLSGSWSYVITIRRLSCRLAARPGRDAAVDMVLAAVHSGELRAIPMAEVQEIVAAASVTGNWRSREFIYDVVSSQQQSIQAERSLADDSVRQIEMLLGTECAAYVPNENAIRYYGNSCPLLLNLSYLYSGVLENPRTGAPFWRGSGWDWQAELGEGCLWALRASKGPLSEYLVAGGSADTPAAMLPAIDFVGLTREGIGLATVFGQPSEDGRSVRAARIYAKESGPVWIDSCVIRDLRPAVDGDFERVPRPDDTGNLSEFFSPFFYETGVDASRATDGDIAIGTVWTLFLAGLLCVVLPGLWKRKNP